MRNRVNSAVLSSALFTVALLCLIPAFWANVLTSRDQVWLAKLEGDYRLATERVSDLSVVCLAVILIALIVVWSGYVKRVRWTWAVMFVVVWVWAFPLLALPPFKALFTGRMALTFPEWILSAIYESGFLRAEAERVLIFLLMVIALLLPVRSFFFIKETHGPSHKPSPKLIGFYGISILAIMLGLFTWVRIGVLYEIPLGESNSAQQLPPPPPPPAWGASQ
jgi:hypothetical protein